MATACCARADPSPILVSMVQTWDKCFHASAQSQFIKNIEAEPNMVAERAFQACDTEEQSISVYFTLNGMAPETARSVILKHRNLLKQKLIGPTPR